MWIMIFKEASIILDIMLANQMVYFGVTRWKALAFSGIPASICIMSTIECRAETQHYSTHRAHIFNIEYVFVSPKAHGRSLSPPICSYFQTSFLHSYLSYETPFDFLFCFSPLPLLDPASFIYHHVESSAIFEYSYTCNFTYI